MGAGKDFCCLCIVFSCRLTHYGIASPTATAGAATVAAAMAAAATTSYAVMAWVLNRLFLATPTGSKGNLTSSMLAKHCEV